MSDFFKFLSDNIGWIFLFFLIFGGGISELIHNWQKEKTKRAQEKTKQLELQLKLADKLAAKPKDAPFSNTTYEEGYQGSPPMEIQQYTSHLED